MLNRSTLSLLQQAGESLYAAQQAVSQDVRTHAEGVVNAVASAPFSPDADRAYAQLRNVARLAQELQALDEQLRALYASASAMGSAAPQQLLAALPTRKRAAQAPGHALPSSVQADLPQDASIKRPALAHRPASTSASAATEPGPQLSKNDEKVLAHLTRTLKRDSWIALTYAAIARGAGIPLGSVGIAVKRLIHSGRVEEAERGLYRLG